MVRPTTEKKSPAGAELGRLSFRNRGDDLPAALAILHPQDSAPRALKNARGRSTSEPAAPGEVMGRAAGSTAGLPDQNTASGYAILHGLARRTAPQTQPPRSGSRASRWAAQESPAGKQVTPAGPR